MADITNKNYALIEMMTHIPLCTHANANSVLVVGDNAKELDIEIKKHQIKPIYTSKLINSKDKYDIIIYLYQEYDKSTIQIAKHLLNDDGIFVSLTQSYFRNKQKLKDDLLLIGGYFWICMPFRFGHTWAILASKKYHPQADIVLQKSDLLEDLNYYNTQIHNCSFVLPTNEHKELTNIAKR